MHAQKLIGATFCTAVPLLTITGTETVHDTTVLMSFCVRGKAGTKAASNVNATTPTTDHNTGLAFPVLVGGASVANVVGSACVVVWAYTYHPTSPTIKCMMGAHVKLDIDDNFVITPQFPTIKDDVCPFAYTVLKSKAAASATAIVFGTSNWDATGYTQTVAASATAIVFGTSNWDATGYTQTVQHIFTMPDRPQTT